MQVYGQKKNKLLQNFEFLPPDKCTDGKETEDGLRQVKLNNRIYPQRGQWRTLDLTKSDHAGFQSSPHPPASCLPTKMHGSKEKSSYSPLQQKY